MQRKSTKVECICQRCGGTFLAYQSAVRAGNAKYCSWACRNPKALSQVGFWAFVNKTDGCWLWTGYTIGTGYGSLAIGGRKALAHRHSWEMHFGPIPKGWRVLHRCDTPGCVRPDHLFLGTAKDNTQDMLAKEREARGERHGHAKFTEQDIRDIRARYAEGGVSFGKLGEEYGVESSTIFKIVHKQRWKHVT